MEPENHLRYAAPAQSSDIWPWLSMPTPAHDPMAYNLSPKIYPDPAYSQGSSSPGLPSNTPEPADISHYEVSPSIPIDNIFFGEIAFPHPDLEPPNVPLPADEAAFNALLAEVVSPSSSESFDDLVDWSGTSTSGSSPPLVENYLSPSPITFPTLSADNSPSAILMSAPAGLAPAAPLPPLQPSSPPTMHHRPTAPHTCPEAGCGKGFYKKCELRKHSQQHSKPHRCSLCDAFCSAELRGLQRHYWTSHREWAERNEIPRQIGKCDFPGCKYEGRLDNVSRHMRRHSKDRDKRKKRRREVVRALVV